VIALFVGLLGYFAMTEDRTFAEDSRRLVQNAINGRQRALARVTLDYAVWDDAYEATTLEWDQSWLNSQYYSTVLDAVFVAGLDGDVRYAWVSEGVREAAIEPAALGAFLRPAAAIDLTAGEPLSLVRNEVIAFGDGIGFVSIVPISPEETSEREARDLSGAVNYLITVEVLGDEAIAAMGYPLGLEDLVFTPRPEEYGPVVSLPLTAHDSSLGALQWRHERPGSAAFRTLVAPILVALILIGVAALFVARALVSAQVRALAQAQTAESSNRMRADFIAAMSHEFRTPLNAIIGYAELIREELSEDERAREIGIDAAHILKASRHLLGLINDILDHTRIDAGRLHLTLEDIPVADALVAAEELANPLALANGVQLFIVNEAAHLEVRADELRLRQCLLNLVGNAIKFARHGTVRLTAKDIGENGDTRVAFEVADDGIGISETALAKLFRPFEQADDTVHNRFGGAGLGLSISKKLATAMGGDITARSEGEGRGAVFTLVLPALSVSPAGETRIGALAASA
jgi:signal transduction histidine kinase